jgi:BirA family biotin operon repressor/biotin-[acetyl-CoA-carboxylase] ligase
MTSRWIKHDSLTSTSSFLSDLLKHQKLDEGTVVIADYQDSGRGQGEHSWLSSRGENLTMSFLLFPAFLSASRQFHLSRMASLALCDALEILGVDSVIKWPNDILSTRGKIAGILIEHSITAGSITRTIAGIGLNLNQTVFPSFPVPASSVRLETGKDVDVSEVGELVETCLMSRYQALKKGKTDQLEKEYLDLLYKAGVPAVFKVGEEESEGVIKGVNEFGELMIELNGEIRTFGHGAVSMELNFDQA